MKQEEKSRLMRAKIMDAAFLEFGEKTYAEASVNTICDQNHISKGILYHYYENKEAIYLACITLCFEAIMDYLKSSLPEPGQGADRDLSAYFDVRLRFFEENPRYWGVFYQASLTPPQHLKRQIEEIRKPFDGFNAELFFRILAGAKLRSGVTHQQVGELLILYQNFVNSMANMRETAQNPQEREALSVRWVGILLHGILE